MISFQNSRPSPASYRFSISKYPIGWQELKIGVWRRSVAFLEFSLNFASIIFVLLLLSSNFVLWLCATITCVWAEKYISVRMTHRFLLSLGPPHVSAIPLLKPASPTFAVEYAAEEMTTSSVTKRPLITLDSELNKWLEVLQSMPTEHPSPQYLAIRKIPTQ